MSFYDDMQALAGEVLAEFKQGIIRYGVVTPGNGPVDNPGAPATIWTVINATAAGVQFKYVQNSLALASDLQVTMPANNGIVPKPVDTVEIDGVPYKIVQILPKPAAGTPVAFVLIVRR